MEKTMGYMLLYCLFYVVPVSVLGLVLYGIFRKRFNYKTLLWQDFLFLLPGIVYCSIDEFHLVKSGKTMGSLCMELLLLALCSALFFWIRLFIAIKRPGLMKKFYVFLIPLMCIIVIAIMYFMPIIPE